MYISKFYLLYELISDIANGFGTNLKSEHVSPLVGDTVSVMCQASQFAFTPPHFYMEIPGSGDMTLSNTTGLAISEQL